MLAHCNHPGWRLLGGPVRMDLVGMWLTWEEEEAMKEEEEEEEEHLLPPSPSCILGGS